MSEARNLRINVMCANGCISLCYSHPSLIFVSKALGLVKPQTLSTIWNKGEKFTYGENVLVYKYNE